MSGVGRMPADPGAVRTRIGEALARDSARWLATRRWFADKGRPVTKVEPVDLLIDIVPEGVLALVIADVMFGEGDAARYFLPLVVPAPEASDDETTAPLPGGAELIDATETSWFGGWLLAALGGQRVNADNQWEFSTIEGMEPMLESARVWPGSVMRAEQSNTSIRFDEALIIKLVRRLQPAPNPEEETLRVLAAARFSATPAFAGGASWRDEGGVRFPILTAQAFVPNLGDGWSWTLTRLSEVATSGGDFGQFAPERLLGERTADLHIVLSHALEPAFTPVRADQASAEREAERTKASINRVVALLRDEQSVLTDATRARLPEIIPGLEDIGVATEGFRAEVGQLRIRVHGDYHLGQTLRTTDEDWMIIDFEGEPARPVSERRERTSALKDVAGMLRSFGYARGAFERESGDAFTAARWEKGARAAFLAGYRQRLRDANARLIPEDEGEFRGALQAWELDKALYEIAYEARNRPDWLDLPLRALLPGLFDQSPGTGGAAPA